MKSICYCRACNQFELVDRAYGYDNSCNFQCNNTKTNQYTNHRIRIDEIKKLDKDSDNYEYYMDKYFTFHKSTDRHIDKEKSYYNDFSDFKVTMYTEGNVVDIDLLKKIIDDNINNSNKKIVEEINQHNVKVTREKIEEYSLVFNLKEKYKKNKIGFYINGVKQSSWKTNVESKMDYFISYEFRDYFENKDEENFNKYQYIAYLGEIKESLDLLIKYPCLEVLIKSNCLFSISERLLKYINVKGTTPTDILKIDKNRMKMLKGFINDEYKLLSYYPYEYETALSFIQKHPKLTYEKFNDIYKTYSDYINLYSKTNLNCGSLNFVNYLNLVSLIIDEGYDYKTLIKYLIEDCRELQGMYQVSHSFMHIKDYIDISNELEMPYDKYPRSLKLEHDKIVYLKLLRKDELSNKKIAKRIESLSPYTYEDKELGYKIILPEKAIDLKREGSELSHCVGSYIDKFARGDCNIFFMRDLNKPDKSLVTIELNEHMSLVQARGFGNRDLDENERLFLNKWLKHVKKVDINENKKESA